MEIGRPAEGTLAAQVTAANSANGTGLSSEEIHRLAGRDRILRPEDLIAAGFSEVDAHRIYDAVRVQRVNGRATFEALDLRVQSAPTDRLQQPASRGSVAPDLFQGRFQAVAGNTRVHRAPILPPAKPLPASSQIPNFHIRDQLEGNPNASNNACGTSSLYSVLAFHKGERNVDFRSLDRAVRPARLDMGSGPTDITDYARKAGMATSLHLSSTTQDLRRMVAGGLPPILLINPRIDENGSGLHYVVVTGYNGLDDRNTTWTIANPWGGVTETMTTAQLERAWYHIRLEGVETPLDNLMITLAPKARQGELPSNNANLAEQFAMGTVEMINDGGKLVEDIQQAARTTRDVLRYMPRVPGMPFGF